jgi:hypothetical protein
MKKAVLFVAFAVAVTCLVDVSCGKSTPSAPSQAPSSVPPPAATPSPAPASRVHGPSIGAICDRLPLSQVPDQNCSGGEKDFVDAVNRAVDVAVSKPDLVNGTTILRLGLYYYDIVKTLSDAGYCAIWDNGLELQVRDARNPGDRHSESYRLDGNAQVRRAFRTSCDEASFPKEQPDYGLSEGCPTGVRLAASREITCTFNQVQLRPQERSSFEDDVRSAILAVMGERPDLVNGGVIQNESAYGEAVAQKLRAGGFCAVPGDEMAVKRPADDNRFSEQFRIAVNRNGLSANPDGPYRTTCYPASF